MLFPVRTKLWWIRWMLAWLSYSFLLSFVLMIGNIILSPSSRTLRKLTSARLSSFIIIFTLQMWQKINWSLWFDHLAVRSETSLLSPTSCPGFNKMIVIFQRPLCFFIFNRMASLNLPNPQHGTLYSCKHTHKDTFRSDRNRLSRTHTHKSMRRCRRQNMVNIDSY